MKRKHRRPTGATTDDEVLDLLIDAVLGGSKRVREVSTKIVKAQRQLRALVSDDAWKAYLRLEELANERASLQMELLARWAVETRSRRLQ